VTNKTWNFFNKLAFIVVSPYLLRGQRYIRVGVVPAGYGHLNGLIALRSAHLALAERCSSGCISTHNGESAELLEILRTALASAGVTFWTAHSSKLHEIV
jgi:hypothetical protein